MDGDFVPNLTFGPKFISNVRKFSNKVFDVHLMINRVEKFLDDYIRAGSDIITFHIEINEGIENIIKKIKAQGIKCGLAIKPKTSWSEIQPYLKHIDQVIITIMIIIIIDGASVVQWLVRWTLGRRARVRVLPGACRCILKQDALPTLLRLSDKT